jgi:lipoprotein NlpI
MTLNDHNKAISDFSESIILRPDQTRTFLLRGLTYLSAGDKDKAKTDFDEVLRQKRGLSYIATTTFSYAT